MEDLRNQIGPGKVIQKLITAGSSYHLLGWRDRTTTYRELCPRWGPCMGLGSQKRYSLYRQILQGGDKGRSAFFPPSIFQQSFPLADHIQKPGNKGAWEM